MKKVILIIILGAASMNSFAQSQGSGEMKTLLGGNPLRSSGGYGAISNKFTTIDGQYANLVELYGGWYVNQRFMIGLGGGATTNNIPVPSAYSALPGVSMSYEYGQFGLVTEYVVGSNKAFHLVFNVMTGAGFTLQYNRFNYHELSNYQPLALDDDWFFVVEPGVQLEINVFKWMRFSPGYSYRMAYGSNAVGLSDKTLSGNSLNLTLKFGKF